MTDKPPDSTLAVQVPNVRLEVQGASGRRTWAFYARPNGPADDEAGGGLSLLEMLDLLRRSRRHMLIGALALVGLGAAYLWLAAPIYDVGAQILVLQRTVLANLGERQSGTALFLATQAEIISSPLVIASALEALPQAPEVSIGEDGEDAVGTVASLVSATPIKGTNVLSLRYIGPSPTEGQSILSAVIESYRRFMREIDHADHRKDIQVLAAHEAELRQQLEEAVAQYSTMQSKNALAGAGSSLVDRLSSELVLARARRIKLENERFALAEHGHLSTGRQESLSREKLVEQLWRVEVRATELRAQYGDRHPDVGEADQEVAALKDELAKLNQREGAALEGEVKAARSTEARLGEAYRLEVERAKEIEARRFDQIQLKDAVDRLVQNHQSALANLRREELTEQGLAEGRPMVAIHVLEPPIVPASPLWPRPLLVMAPCIAIGALLGLGAAWLRERLRATNADSNARSASQHGATAAIESATPGARALSRAGTQ